MQRTATDHAVLEVIISGSVVVLAFQLGTAAVIGNGSTLAAYKYHRSDRQNAEPTRHFKQLSTILMPLSIAVTRR